MRNRLGLGVSILGTISLTLVSFGARGQDKVSIPEPTLEAVADRISMAMRGVPATTQDRNIFRTSDDPIKELVQQYSQTPRFEELMTRFWLDQLQISGRVSLQDTIVTKSSEINEPMSLTALIAQQPPRAGRVTRTVFLNQPAGPACEPRLELVPGMLVPVSPDSYQSTKDACDKAKRDGDANSTDCSRQASLDRIQATWDQFAAVHKCPCGTEINVRPHWNPQSIIKACPSVITASDFQRPGSEVVEICGTNLRNCFPSDPFYTTRFKPSLAPHLDNSPLAMPGGSYLGQVMSGVTEEPGRLIARIIAERGDFRTTLTETRTRLNGSYENFLTTPAGKRLLAQLPPSSFKGADGKLLLQARNGQKDQFRWVERGKEHAGILTTWAFHQFTNGYRAKANRVYETFLCDRFVIEKGVTESNPDEPNITKRQPCASCHVILEPMGNFFNQWERVGTNYAYNPARRDRGAFFLQGNKRATPGSGLGLEGLGQILPQDARFDKCVAQRAFEFVMGRSPSQREKASILAKAEQDFKQGHDFLAAVEAIFRGSDFFREVGQ